MAQSLVYLSNNGVTYEDIINMTQLIVSLQGSNFLTSISSQRGNTTNGVGNNKSEKNGKDETWKLSINKLRNMINLDSEIEKRTIQLNELESSINLNQVR